MERCIIIKRVAKTLNLCWENSTDSQIKIWQTRICRRSTTRAFLKTQSFIRNDIIQYYQNKVETCAFLVKRSKVRKLGKKQQVNTDCCKVLHKTDKHNKTTLTLVLYQIRRKQQKQQRRDFRLLGNNFYCQIKMLTKISNTDLIMIFVTTNAMCSRSNFVVDGVVFAVKKQMNTQSTAADGMPSRCMTMW